VASRAWKGDAAQSRWQRIAVASAKQCGRAVVPDVLPVRALDALLAAANAEAMLMCVEPSHDRAVPVALETIDRPKTALAFVGPEGGWGAAELELAARASVRFVHLGPRTLRAEAAPAVLLSALWTVWGW
jgi:16S rRNA (uracil1498-N3)-methyltransferase